MSIYGYKAMEPDMTCRGFKFAVGETYHVDGPPELCRHGFHFCQKPADVFAYYERYGSIVCEVEAIGDVVTHGTKSCTDRIRILRRLPPIMESRLKYDGGYGDSGGCGYGYGYGYGCGYRRGGGCGYGYGDGYGYSDGGGYGCGYGFGSGYGYGYSYGYGRRINRAFIWED